MKLNELKVIPDEVLSYDERKDLAIYIDNIINRHKHDRQAINSLVFESVEALTEADMAQTELENKGFFKRLLGEFSGSNQRLQNKINRNRSAAQFASQQMLVKLSEQNLMNFELTTAINYKLNASINRFNEQFKYIYDGLEKFFTIYRGNLAECNLRIKRLEKNVDILTWLNSIEYLNLNGESYYLLSDVGKAVCLARDFYDISNGTWDTKELMLLKAAMGHVGLNPSKKTNYMKVMKEIANSPVFKNKLLAGKKIVSIKNPDHIIGMSLIKKLEDLNGSEEHVVSSNNSIQGSYEDTYNKEVIIDEKVSKYMKTQLHVDSNTNITAYDLIIDLLFNLKSADDLNIYYDENKIKSEKGYRIISTIIDSVSGAIYESEQNYEKAFESYIRLANQGIAFYQYKVGDMYYAGNGVIQNIDEALKWYKSAANKGNVNAQYQLAGFYYEGDVLEPNKALAFKWFKKAADNGHKESQFISGIMLYEGEGVQANHTIAFDYFHKAAEQGDVKSQYMVGYMYNRGEGVARNNEQAFNYLTKAAEQGDVKSQYMVGLMYYRGDGVTQNNEQAFNYFIKAAEQGNADSQFLVAVMYQEGCGVERNWFNARDWFIRAAQNGNEDAQASCSILNLQW